MISIIVPIYNTKIEYLERSLHSIDMQGLDLEVLLIDDGSAKETACYVDSLKTKYRVFHKENGGVSSARNYGLDRCTGEYVAFMDPDDELMNGYLADALSQIVENGADAIFGGMEYVYPSGKTKVDTQSFSDSQHYFLADKDDISYMMRSLFEKDALLELGLSPIQYVSNCGALYRRASIGELRFDEQVVISEDRIFNYQFFQKASLIAISDGIWYRYFQNPDSASHQVRTNAKNELITTSEKYVQLLGHSNQSAAIARSVQRGVLECFYQTLQYTIFDPLFDSDFRMSKVEYTSQLVQIPIYQKAFEFSNIKQFRWGILAALGRGHFIRGILAYMYCLRFAQRVKLALPH